MDRIRISLALTIAMCAIAATAFASSAAARSPESLMLHKVNHYRKTHGLRAVHLSRSLKHSAAHYARHMMRKQYFGHARRIHASSHFRRLGEILEWQRGMRPNVSLAFHTWLRSGPHRAIILDRSFTYAGAGRTNGRFQDGKATLWVMHFGRP
jgi:uncharacterized protein YkwD